MVEIKATGELSACVESFWENNGSLVLPPDGTFNLICASSPFDLILGKNKQQLAPGAYLCPILEHVVQLQAVHKVWGIRFKAFAMANIFKGKSTPGLFHPLSISGLEGPLLDKTKAGVLFEEVLPLLELTAFELLNQQMEADKHLREKVNYILDRKGMIQVQDMQEEFGVSRQSLSAQFNKYMGISPKQLSNIWRSNYFFTLLEDRNGLTGASLDAGYYDQAHSIHDFKKKFGTTPLNFIKSSPTSLLIAQSNMQKRFQNYFDPEE